MNFTDKKNFDIIACMKKKNRGIIWVCLFAFIILAAIAINWILILQKAHSTFENYYVFRGCTRLVKRTNTYGLCQLSSGQTIKLVKFENKWFLDGDLPICKFHFCF